MQVRLSKAVFLPSFFVIVSAVFAGLAHAQSSENNLGARAPSCVPGQQVACACIGSGSGVQRCERDGASYGPCLGCRGEAASKPSACDVTGSWQFVLSWQTSKCTSALDKTAFAVTRSLSGFSIEDRSDGVPDKATIKVERTAKGCALTMSQDIDPEGAIAGSKTVAIDKYQYRLVESNGRLTGTAWYQNFQFGETPVCTGWFQVTGFRATSASRR